MSLKPRKKRKFAKTNTGKAQGEASALGINTRRFNSA